MSRVGRGFVYALLMELTVILVLFVTVTRVHAQTAYTSDDTLAAIDQAADEIGVSYAWLYAVVKCETAGTFNPYSIGRQGELGAAQLHPRGELRRFLSWGYLDPFSPWQSIRFMAQEFSFGRARQWSCA